MSRDYVMGLMKSLKFVAIPKAYDEVLATARKRKQTTETVIEQLFEIEVSERQARSIRYRMTQARFPVSKDLDSFEFDKLSVEETQIKSLYGGDFIEEHRNIVFVGGTGTGKTHLVTALPRRLCDPAIGPSFSTWLIWPTSSNRKNSTAKAVVLPIDWLNRGSGRILTEIYGLAL